MLGPATATDAVKGASLQESAIPGSRPDWHGANVKGSRAHVSSPTPAHLTTAAGGLGGWLAGTSMAPAHAQGAADTGAAHAALTEHSR